MAQHTTLSEPRRIVGWLPWSVWCSAGVAVLYVAAANFDFEVLVRPLAMLAFVPGSQNLYRLSMWADILDGELGEVALRLPLVMHALWLFLFGISLLRKRAPARVGMGMAPAA